MPAVSSSRERSSPAVERLRADLAQLGGDAASAGEVPSAVTEQVLTALRSAAPAERPPRSRGVRAGALLGVAAAVVVVAVGATELAASDRSPVSSPAPTPPTSEPPVPTIPLTDEEILALLRVPPDLGALDDPRRRASCLSGLGYAGSTAVLGGRQLVVAGEPAVLLVLPDDTPPTDVAAVAVRPSCSAADTGLLVEKQIPRP
jgi:hypothetical protein